MRLDTARTAERATPHLIRINAHAVKTDVWNVVRPADNLRANLHTTGMAGKAGVEVKRGLPRRQSSALVTPVLMVIALAERFPQKNSSCRDSTSLTGRRVRETAVHSMARWRLELAAKAAADVRHDHPHLGERESNRCARRARTICVLCVLVHTVTLPFGSTWATVAMGSEIPLMHGAGAERVFVEAVGLGKACSTLPQATEVR